MLSNSIVPRVCVPAAGASASAAQDALGIFSRRRVRALLVFASVMCGAKSGWFGKPCASSARLDAAATAASRPSPNASSTFAKSTRSPNESSPGKTTVGGGAAAASRRAASARWRASGSPAPRESNPSVTWNFSGEITHLERSLSASTSAVCRAPAVSRSASGATRSAKKCVSLGLGFFLAGASVVAASADGARSRKILAGLPGDSPPAAARGASARSGATPSAHERAAALYAYNAQEVLSSSAMAANKSKVRAAVLEW
mmetsp:Transcript_17302/g.49413  ORF Transcript_17302/g.49413 Transcript_17302/m.49413 type:complete len:259 (+) Transcript_17302:224-1000(+)